jgi:chromosome segregation ATPase
MEKHVKFAKEGNTDVRQLNSRLLQLNESVEKAKSEVEKSKNELDHAEKVLNGVFNEQVAITIKYESITHHLNLHCHR